MADAEDWAFFTLFLKAAKLQQAIKVWQRQENKTALLHCSSLRETPPTEFNFIFTLGTFIYSYSDPQMFYRNQIKHEKWHIQKCKELLVRKQALDVPLSETCFATLGKIRKFCTACLLLCQKNLMSTHPCNKFSFTHHV